MYIGYTLLEQIIIPKMMSDEQAVHCGTGKDFSRSKTFHSIILES